MDYLLNKGIDNDKEMDKYEVLNLIINGLPSKLSNRVMEKHIMGVLNLIINGLPSKLHQLLSQCFEYMFVLNLIINGLPSKQ